MLDDISVDEIKTADENIASTKNESTQEKMQGRGQVLETVQEKVAEEIADNQEGQQVLIDETVIPKAAEQVIGIEAGEEIIEDTAQNDLAQKVDKICEHIDDFSEEKEVYEAEIRQIIKTFTTVEGLSLGLFNLGVLMDEKTRGEVEADLAQKLVENYSTQEEIQKKLSEVYMDIKTRNRIEAMVQEKIAQNSSGETKKEDTKKENVSSENSQEGYSIIDRICSLDYQRIEEEILRHPEFFEDADSDIYKYVEVLVINNSKRFNKFS